MQTIWLICLYDNGESNQYLKHFKIKPTKDNVKTEAVSSR
jgi:hypothetical protein